MYKLRKVGVALKDNVMRKIMNMFRCLKTYPQSEKQTEQT